MESLYAKNKSHEKNDLYIPSPKTGVGEEEDEEIVCPICREQYKEHDEICYSPNPRCTHSFHVSCMKPWLFKHDRCPVCRNNYLLDPGTMGEKKEHHAANRQTSDRANPMLRLSIVSAFEEIRREIIASNTAAAQGDRGAATVRGSSDIEQTITVEDGDLEEGSGIIMPFSCASSDTNFSKCGNCSMPERGPGLIEHDVSGLEVDVHPSH